MSLTHQLSALEASGLILLAQRQPEIEYLFRHALVQEAAYASLVRIDRRRLHAAVGQALEGLYPARRESHELAPVLARHFAEAGDQARALRYYTVAAHGAAAMYANAEAVLLFDQALALAHTLHAGGATLTELYLQRGHTLELNAQDAAAIANYEALADWAATAGDEAARLAALGACATICVKPSVEQNLARGYELSQQALALARALNDPAAEAKVYWNLLQYHLATGDLSASLAAGERAMAIARQHQLREQLAYVLTDMTKAYFQADQAQRSEAALAEATTLWRELGVPNMLADNLATRSMMHVMSGDFDQALALSAEAQRISRQIGNQWNEAYALYLLNLLYLEQGELGLAVASAETCQRLSAQAGFAEGVNQSSFNLALIYAEAGALDKARAAAQHLLAPTESLASVYPFGPQVLALDALLTFYEGQPAQAQAVLDNAKFPLNAETLKDQFVLTQIMFGLVMSELALARGEAEAALAVTDDMERSLKVVTVRLFRADALLLRGRALRLAGRPAEALAALAAARAEAEALGSRRTLWVILAALADLAAEQGRAAEAQTLRQQSADIILYIAAHAGSDDLARSFLNRPPVRQVLQSAGRSTAAA